jgi:hypothetical protein
VDGLDRPPVGLEIIDDIERWAEAAYEDDPSNTLAQNVLHLVQDLRSLRELVRLDRDGQLAVVVRLQAQLEEQDNQLVATGKKLEELRTDTTKLLLLADRFRQRFTY